MKLSTKGRYGLRALLDIAQNSGDGEIVSIQSIARRQDISESYLEQLIRKLKTAGFLNSVRGAGGGYVLAKEPQEITVGDVLRALEGSIKAVNCGGEIMECERADLCVTRLVWERVNSAIEEAVDGITLRMLLDESEKKQTKEMPDTGHCGS